MPYDERDYMRRLRTIGVLAAAVTALALLPGSASAAGGSSGSAGSAGSGVRAVKADRSVDVRGTTNVTRTNGFAVYTEFTGTMAAGAEQYWIWTNIGLNTAYRVGFNPAGASTSSPCSFEVVNDFYERLASGERRYHFIFRNISGISCGATVLLSAASAVTGPSAGGMNPGETKVLTHNLGQDGTNAYLAGLVPSGATSSQTCQFKVLRTWYHRLRQGDVSTPTYLKVEVQNVGAITCVANLEVGSDPVDSLLPTYTLNPGQQTVKHWNNANPTSAVHLISIQPEEVGCAIEVTRYYYRQVINSNGASERELYFTLRNVGTIACSFRPSLARI